MSCILSFNGGVSFLCNKICETDNDLMPCCFIYKVNLK